MRAGRDGPTAVAVAPPHSGAEKAAPTQRQTRSLPSDTPHGKRSLALGGLLAPRGPLWHLVARWPGFLRASAMRGTKTLSACSTVSLHPGPLLFYPVPLASLPEVLL